MYNAYMHYAPQWGQVVKEHISFHEVSSFNAGEGELVYICSSVEALKAKLAGITEKDSEVQLAPCYAFPSFIQAV
eukprot:4244788-Amphidinium_carterae.1